MSDYVQTAETTAACTSNSGIPNHAFYLAATPGGNAWDLAGRVLYETLRDPHLRPTAQFRTFARLTLMSVQRLGHAHGSPEYQAVQVPG